MVGSIDPRCETLRGTHWPVKVAGVFGARVAETILASGPTRPHQQAGHMDASDPIRPSKNSCGTGAVHIWVPASAGATWGWTRDSSFCAQLVLKFGPMIGVLLDLGRVV